jgi:DNA segregation ATPase FtsK/SpoIIIE-like protein
MTATRLHVYPDRIELVNGSGCAFNLFGCPFVLVGLFMLLFVTLSAEHIEHHSLVERLGAGAAGLAFMFAGALFAFGKSGIVIDKTESVIRRWNGLSSFRFVSDTFPLKDFSRFAIEQRDRNNYVVIIQGGNTTITLLSAQSHAVACEQAEQIGAFVPLECDDEVQPPSSVG